MKTVIMGFCLTFLLFALCEVNADENEANDIAASAQDICPLVVVVDKEGIVRLAYYSTFWGDYPSIHQVVEMVRKNRCKFELDRRLRVKDGN